MASNYTGNTHGSILEVNGRYYIFYHRHTNRSCFSRQACAEEIFIGEDGSIKQVETTSCGLNGGPLKGAGTYEARIACNLFSKNGARFHGSIFKAGKGGHPYFTQAGKDRENNPDQYIANFCDGATAGFKYFDLEDVQRIAVSIKGSAQGRFVVRTKKDGIPVCIIPVLAKKNYENFCGNWNGENGISALYFTYEGKGKCDFRAFTIN